VIDLQPERSADSFAKVHELHRGGHTQLEIAEKVGIGAETVSRCLNAPAFPERWIRNDRRRDQALFLQSRKRGLQPSLTRTHYSAGRVSALLNMPPQTLSEGQKRHLDAFMRFCPGAHIPGVRVVGFSTSYSDQAQRVGRCALSAM
jgi:hypothetical protein